MDKRYIFKDVAMAVAKLKILKLVTRDKIKSQRNSTIYLMRMANSLDHVGELRKQPKF